MESKAFAPDDWAKKVVLITGASEGIGAGCARSLARRGARLVLTALSSAEIPDATSDDRLIVAGDITSEQTRTEVVRKALDHFGHIDVLINNAGVGQYGFATQVDLDISKRMFDVNVFSALALTQ